MLIKNTLIVDIIDPLEDVQLIQRHRELGETQKALTPPPLKWEVLD
jgi:hypothetical protein